VKSKVFNNADFGYWKIVVERPLRLSARFTDEVIAPLRLRTGPEELREKAWEKHAEALIDAKAFAELKPRLEKMADAHEPKLKARARKQFLDFQTWRDDAETHDLARQLQEHFGAERQWDDFAQFETDLKAALKELDIKVTTAGKKPIVEAVTFTNPEAEPVVAKEVADYSGSDKERREKRHFGLFRIEKEKKAVRYKPDTALKDTEQVPLTEPGGIHAYFEREVLPHVPDAWIDESKTQIGYEIPFTRHFYEYQPLRLLEEIAEDLRALEAEAEELLEEVLS